MACATAYCYHTKPAAHYVRPRKNIEPNMDSLARSGFIYTAPVKLKEVAQHFEALLGIKIFLRKSRALKGIRAKVTAEERSKLVCPCCGSPLKPFMPDHPEQRRLYDLLSDANVLWELPRFQCTNPDCPLREEHAEKEGQKTKNRPTHVVAPDFIKPYEQLHAELIGDLLCIWWWMRELSKPQAALQSYQARLREKLEPLRQRYESIREGLWRFILSLADDHKLMRRLVSRCAEDISLYLSRAYAGAQKKFLHYKSDTSRAETELKVPVLSNIIILLSKFSHGFSTWPGWRKHVGIVKIDSAEREWALIGKLQESIYGQERRQPGRYGI